MTAPQELPQSLHEQIQALCAAGDALAGERRFEAAVEQYNAAWMLVPEPKQAWNASTWIMAAIGDACFRGGFRTSALEALQFAMHCPGGLGNPFLHLRLGQVLLDQGQGAAAADELTRAYMGAGAEIFAQEDPRYFEYLKTRIEL